jgi:hypothetical protein
MGRGSVMFVNDWKVVEVDARDECREAARIPSKRLPCHLKIDNCLLTIMRYSTTFENLLRKTEIEKASSRNCAIFPILIHSLFNYEKDHNHPIFALSRDNGKR